MRWGIRDGGWKDSERMNKILEGKLILLASHNPLDIDLLCDCVYELDAETIVSQRSKLSQ